MSYIFIIFPHQFTHPHLNRIIPKSHMSWVVLKNLKILESMVDKACEKSHIIHKQSHLIKLFWQSGNTNVNLWIKISDIFVLLNCFFTSCEILRRGFIMFGTKNWTCTYVWNSDPLSIVLNYEESSHVRKGLFVFIHTFLWAVFSL